MSEDTRSTTHEYDRFGPWIDEVTTAEDVPRLYRDHPLDLAGARLVLKVPRNIARRDATPDMDLYDHLLVADADRLTVLSRQASGPYSVRSVALREVVAVRDVVSLLDGRLTVHTADGATLSVAYNGSARANVSRLVDELRTAAAELPSAVGRALLAAARTHAQTPPVDAGPDDVGVTTQYLEAVRQRPGLRPWVWHGRSAVRPLGSGAAGAVRSLTHAISPMTLHGAVLAADELVLEVFGRHEWLVRGSSPVHSASRLVLPLAAPDGLQVGPHPRYAGATTVTVTAGASRVELVVPTGSPAHRLLGVAATGA
ncbi:hypothetical protein [uncultured Cellulomonas sp.]|uniref:hypothetical protein n=1 Tax=uncultured Cellulomonas sp. TaxID=189682 RepID=UPI0028F0213A|nr:hypothetical protein [uncultured Cellulomonas sp.]